MNYITRTKEFKKYEAAFGSTFAAIKYVSLLARKRCEEVHHCITESQALAWVVSGQEPISVIQYKLDAAKRIERAKHYVDDRISYIDDIEIREAVKHSIHESKRSGHLIYGSYISKLVCVLYRTLFGMSGINSIPIVNIQEI